MRDCPDDELRDLLPDFAADRLVEADRARVVAHVAACDACAAEVELLREARQALRQDVPDVDVGRILAALPEPPSAVVRPWIVPSVQDSVVHDPAARGLLAHEPLFVPPRAGKRRSSSGRRRQMWTGWRIAATVSTIAVGGLSLALVRGLVSSRESAAYDQVNGRLVLPGTNAVAGAPLGATGEPGPHAAVARGGTIPSPAVGGAAGTPGQASSGGGLAVAASISELSDGEVESLLQDLDGLDATPADEPEAEAPGLHRVVEQ
jgi:hypothetical protein